MTAPQPQRPYDIRADALDTSPARDRYLYAKYGLHEEAYNAMLIAQGYVCIICGNPHHSESPLVVDHNHGTGQVRGLLCNECNAGIGLLGDSPLILRAAAEYLVARGDYDTVGTDAGLPSNTADAPTTTGE